MKFKFLAALTLFVFQRISAQSWIPQGEGMLPVGYAIMSISVVDDSVIWINASREMELFYGQPVSGLHIIKVLRSTDGGETWTSENVVESLGRISFELEATDANTAWLTTQDYNSGRGRVLYKTTDGGQTWAAKLTHYAASGFVDVLDESHIYCQVTDVQGWSDDGGETWSMDTIDGFDAEEYTIVASGNNWTASKGDTIWVGTSRGNVIRLTDYGETHEIINVGFETTVQCISFIDHRRGMLFYADPVSQGILRTFDQGDTWEETVSKPETSKEYNIVYVPGTEHTFVAVSNIYAEAAEYYWTTNFGDTWHSGGEIDNANTNAISFISPTTGWVTSGVITRENQPIVYKWSGDVLSGIRDELKPLTDLSIYPNPVTGVLNYDFNEYSAAPHRFSISDMNGRVLASGTSSSNAIHISQIPSGMYVLSVESDTHHGRVKFVKNAR